MFSRFKTLFAPAPPRAANSPRSDSSSPEFSDDGGNYSVPGSPSRPESRKDGLSRLSSLLDDTDDDIHFPPPYSVPRGSSFSLLTPSSDSSVETSLSDRLVASKNKRVCLGPGVGAGVGAGSTAGSTASTTSGYDNSVRSLSGLSFTKALYRPPVRPRTTRRNGRDHSFSASSIDDSTLSASLANDDIVVLAVRQARTTTLRPENSLQYAKIHRDKEKLLASIKEWRESGYKARVTPQTPPVKPLAPHLVQLVEQYWKNMPTRKVLGEVHRVQLSVHDLRTLQHGQWLNDNVIDLFLADRTADVPKSFAFTTHFFTRLQSSGYKAVSKWAKRKKVNILDLDHLIVPVNRGNMHWCVGAVDFKRKTISFYDSLARPRGGQDVVSALFDYLVAEADNVEPGKHDAHVALFKSFEQIPGAPSPQQNNGSDCGVFMCQNVVRLVRNEPLAFAQADMPHIRHHMAYRILDLCGQVQNRASL